MSYTYHGVELVNCGPPNKRKGPLERFTAGKYTGTKVEDVIRRDPYYIMWAVKEYLDVSPQQALLFETVTGGGVLPDQYIRNKSPKPVKREWLQKESPPEEDWMEETLDWDIPNYDFSPEIAPDWWPEFKERSKDFSPRQRKQLFEEYQRKDLQKLREMWDNEYRNSRSTE